MTVGVGREAEGLGDGGRRRAHEDALLDLAEQDAVVLGERADVIGNRRHVGEAREQGRRHRRILDQEHALAAVAEAADAVDRLVGAQAQARALSLVWPSLG